MSSDRGNLLEGTYFWSVRGKELSRDFRSEKTAREFMAALERDVPSDGPYRLLECVVGTTDAISALHALPPASPAPVPALPPEGTRWERGQGWLKYSIEGGQLVARDSKGNVTDYGTASNCCGYTWQQLRADKKWREIAPPPAPAVDSAVELAERVVVKRCNVSDDSPDHFPLRACYRVVVKDRHAAIFAAKERQPRRRS